MSDSPVIGGRTQVCGVIGDPIEHTISPAMHNAAFRELALDFIYIPFHVAAHELPHAVQAMRALNIRGFNVTIPHKEKVMPLLDAVDPAARTSGAVNTIVNEKGALKGYNTDAEGFMRALKDNGVGTRGRTAVILGAGGAARAVCFALASAGTALIILNRTRARASDLADEVARRAGHPAQSLAWNHRNLSAALDKGDIIVNTTSVGMAPQSGESPLKGELIRKKHTVVDVVYNPSRTELLKQADKAGAAAVGGIEMLVWQGALAFEKWTGRTAPVDVMRKAALQAVEGR